MSENRPSKKEVRSWGSHSISKPVRPTGLDGVNPIPEFSGKESIMTGPGLFDESSAQDILPNELKLQPVALPKTEREPRRLKFRAKTKLYKFVPDSEGKPKIPYTEAEEDDLFDRALKAPTYLDVPGEFLEIGKNGRTITKKVGQSAFGAFTVVLLPVRQASGEIKLEKRLASYLTRSRRGKI